VNHLAHFHLAGDCEYLVVGALLGDYVKGPLTGALPQALERGVRLHRRVDAFTDSHERLRALRVHFGPGERRLAGVVTDLFFDYLLTRHWSVSMPRRCATSATRVCAILERHAAALSPPAARQARRIVEYDLLCRYGEVDVLEGALKRLGKCCASRRRCVPPPRWRGRGSGNSRRRSSTSIRSSSRWPARPSSGPEAALSAAG